AVGVVGGLGACGPRRLLVHWARSTRRFECRASRQGSKHCGITRARDCQSRRSETTASAEGTGGGGVLNVIASQRRALALVAALGLSLAVGAETAPVVDAPAGAVKGEALGTIHTFK